jgi:hypothetical protein
VNYDDETLMSYADGALEGAHRAEIAVAIAKDPDLAQRVEKHRALRAQVAGAFATVLDQPVPDRLVAAARAEAGTNTARALRGGTVIQFPSKGARAPATAWRAREWGAMAASVLLGLLISWGLYAPSEPGIMVANGGALVARGDLASALERQLASDQPRDGPVQIGVTFKAHDGNYCRSFRLRETKTAGVACRAGGEWQVTATAISEIQAGQMSQAAAAMPAAILADIEDRIDGDALDAAGEQKAQRGGWDR